MSTNVVLYGLVASFLLGNPPCSTSACSGLSHGVVASALPQRPLHLEGPSPRIESDGAIQALSQFEASSDPTSDETDSDDARISNNAITFEGHNGVATSRKKKPLHGRFLHLTDIHPDELYQPRSAISTACHYLTPKPSKSDRSGAWGTPYSDCDTPLSLYNITMNWLEKEWASKVDFVIWTGDNARHDTDSGNPRTPAEIYKLNQMVADRMQQVFGKRGIPVVPCIGNNDIWPHNIMYPGPTSVTNAYVRIWSKFIPFESFQVFQRGAYYSTDLIPNELGALSLNTLYWYDKNHAVDGCKKGQPGRLQLDWMEVQLEAFRQRNMKVWLSGHVPPSNDNYFPDCFTRYGELVIRHQDTIVGQLFGHLNTDHFYWLDAADLHPPPPSPPETPTKPKFDMRVLNQLSELFSCPLSVFSSPSSLFSRLLATGSSASTHFDSQSSTSITKKSTLENTLANAFDAVPGMNKLDFGMFSPPVIVGPSVVPTYLPSVRIFTYNVTELDGQGGQAYTGESLIVDEEFDEDEGENEGEEDEESDSDDDVAVASAPQRRHPHRGLLKYRDCRLKKHSSKKACRVHSPRYNGNPSAPSRNNTRFTPLGYSQFVIENLESLKASSIPKYTLEYMTYHPSVLANTSSYPIPHRLIPAQLLNSSLTPNSDRDSDTAFTLKKHKRPDKGSDSVRTAADLAPYELEDLTIGSYVKLAKNLAIGKNGKKHKKLWRRWVNYMYMDL